MNLMRYLMALVLSIVLIIAADILINAVLMRQAYVDAAQYLLSQDELNARIPWGFGALIAWAAAIGLLFVWQTKRGVAAGLQFGLLLAAALVGGAVGLASLVPWPNALIASIATQQALNAVILGLCFGWIYKTKPMPA